MKWNLQAGCDNSEEKVMEGRDVNVLWVDLCINAGNAYDIAPIQDTGAAYRIQQVDKDLILSALEGHRIDLICLDYDFPDRQSLQLLRQVRHVYPGIPVIMLTLQHCESLAVWAFRTGVRDYLVKPVPVAAIIEILNILTMLAKPRPQDRRVPRRNVLPPPILPNEFRQRAPFRHANRTVLAVCYVETHFNERIMENDVAALCGMSVFVFSRVFRCEHGMTFREFLIRYRIERAKELLRNPAMSATDTAGLAGFGDASSFTQLFRRYVDMTPSCYQKKTRPLKGAPQ